MKKKYIVHYIASKPLTKPMPISAIQLAKLAEKTRYELEEKAQRNANDSMQKNDGDEVIYKWQ